MSELVNGIFLTRTIKDDIPDCPVEMREELAALPGDSQEEHDAHLSRLEPLHVLQKGLKPSRKDRPHRLRVAAWNLERCTHVPASVALLRAEAVDVTFLSEMDVGMARTGQQHTPRGLAGPLGHHFFYGVEFLELGLGSHREQQLNEGRQNLRGFHGNVLSAAFPMADPVMIRFDRDANWFAPDCDERRVGGRMAIAAKVSMARGDVVVVSAHLESRMTAERRAEQMALLIDALETYAPGAPMIIGGDLNTDSDAWTRGKGVSTGGEGWAEIRARTLDPVAHEPLFDVVRAAGFEWDKANQTKPTVRETPQSGPRRYPELKLDWFLTRGLIVENPRTIAAVDAQGTALSDHDLITVDITVK